MSLSCRISNARSIRPFPCGELAKMISIPSSSQARCIWEKLQRFGPPKIPARSTYNVLNTPYSSITERITFRQPVVVSDGKNSAWISLLASSIIAIRQDLLLPNQRCHQPWRLQSLPAFVNPTSPALYAFYMMNIACPFSQRFTLHNDVFIGLQHFSEMLQIQVIVFFTDKCLNLLF